MFYYIVMLALCAMVSPELLASSRTSSGKQEVPEFVLLVLSYNNEKYVLNNMKSICHQHSTRPYQIVCVNDCSTDRTGELMEEYVRKHDLQSMVKIIHNEKRMGMTQNTYNTIHNHIQDHKIVVKVDGDDTLANDNVLLRLEKAYKNPDIWLTYGQAIRIPGGELLSEKIPDEVFYNCSHRKWGFTSIALRTFKAGLFKKIKKEDLMHEGEFFVMSGDEAYMFPMLEMCSPVDANGVNHTVFIKQILYFYNVSNPLNDHHINRKLQSGLAKVIRARPAYKPIERI